MNIDNVEKLLGGYATGTLTTVERKALFDAALNNQALFDALADEEALRELLADPASRAEMLALFEKDLAPVELVAAMAAPRMAAPAPSPGQPPPSLMHRFSQWLFRPIPMAAFATAGIAIVAIVLVSGPSAREARETAMARPARPVWNLKEHAELSLEPRPIARKDAPAAPRQAAAPLPAPREEIPAPPAVAADQVATEQRPAAAVPSSPSPVLEKKKDEDASAAAQQSKERDQQQPQNRALSQSLSQSQIQGQVQALRQAPTPPAPQTKAAAKPPAQPFRYLVERRQADGSWVEFGGELSAGDEARIRIMAQQDGFAAFATNAGRGQTLAVRQGQSYVFPTVGALPSGAGERTVRISFSTALPAAGIAAASAAYRNERGKSGAEAAPQEVTIRLRYR